MERSEHRQRVLSGVVSLLIHGAIFAPALIQVLWQADILDPDSLGTRGARQWADAITLTPSGAGRGAKEGIAAEGGRGVMAVRLVPPLIAEDAYEETDEGVPVEEAQERQEVPPVEEEQDTPADEAEGKGESAASPVEAGEDAAKGAGVGGATQDADGAFVSGDEARELLRGWTLVGFNGFLDGSIGKAQDKKRQKIRWRVYYKRNGRLEARYTRLAAIVPHGDLQKREFSSRGRWWIDGEHLCQAIDKWFYGGTACYEIRRKGDALGMYYVSCYGISRCYKGRLGPRGVLLRGRRF